MAVLVRILFAFLISENVFAFQYQDLTQEQKRQWMAMLHYDSAHGESRIIDSSFFLSEKGRSDPESEWNALISHAQDPVSDDPDEHPRCRFPGRYYWLGSIYDERYKNIPDFCHKLLNWPVLLDTKSISVIFVTGYMGNPASAFGHVFLKLDRSEKDDLMDQSINFGALVPPEESLPAYVIKGIFGGYVAGYSDRYFYTQDVTYSRTELRDMWKYPLNLTESQKMQFLLHVWEILTKKEKYYFLTENCATAVSDVIEAAIGEKVSDDSGFWYSPVEFIHDMSELHLRNNYGERYPILGDAVFIPSAERELKYHFDQLSPAEKDSVISAVQGSPEKIYSVILEVKGAENKVKVADAILGGYQYLYVKEQPDPSGRVLEGRRIALASRFSVNGLSADEYKIEPPTDPPTSSDRPTVLSTGFGYFGSDESFRYIFGFSPFSQESSGKSTLDGSELVFMDAYIAADRQDISFQGIDYVRVRKIALNPLPLNSVDTLSWKVRVATDRIGDFGSDKIHHTASFFAGRAIGVPGFVLVPYVGIWCA